MIGPVQGDGIHLTEDALLKLVERSLVRHGMSEANAPFVATVVAAAERDGAKGHGLLRLPGYVATLSKGHADGRAVPRVTRPAPSMLLVDGANGFAQVALAAVRTQAIEAARTQGAVVVMIRDAHHFAALWPDVEGFAEQGLFAVSMVNSRSHMVAWGGSRKVLGTNPVAFACPRADGPPVVWDQASTAWSQGEVIIAGKAGEPVPDGVGVDADGTGTNDPAAILDGGALLPFSGAKGSNVAFMVEVLVAVLGGGPFGFEVEPNAATGRTGQFVLLLDPARSGRGGVLERVESLLATLCADGLSRLPGDRRYRNREATRRHGIRLGTAEHAALVDLAGAG